MGFRIDSRLGRRFLAVVIPLAILVSAIVLSAFFFLTREVIDEVSLRVSARQVELDRARATAPIVREVSLARTASASESLRDWALNESDPLLTTQGLDTLERFRELFDDRSYFFVIDRSGNYYSNDGSLAPKERLRYSLSLQAPLDQWYFLTRAKPGQCHLNPNHDRVLNVTKLWINCMIRDHGKVVAMVGTGIDLTRFIRESMQASVPDATNLFVDQHGAIQVHPDQSKITLRALTVPLDSSSTIFKLLDSQQDAQTVRQMIERLKKEAGKKGAGKSESRFLQIDGRRHLISLSYIEDLGWFAVSLMDLENRLSDRLRQLSLLLLGAILLTVVAVLLAFNRLVLSRVRKLDQAVREFTENPDRQLSLAWQPEADEIGRLQIQFSRMAESVREQTSNLERLVERRTRELEMLATTDELTGIANRRFFLRRLVEEMKRCGRYHDSLAVILLDVDYFKQVNDTHGHEAGDRVLNAIAQILQAGIRETDLVARYGGEEFTVLLIAADEGKVRAKAEQIRQAVQEMQIALPSVGSIQVTISLGAAVYRIAQGRDPDALLRAADEALYQAKREGRNRVAMANFSSTQ